MVSKATLNRVMSDFENILIKNDLNGTDKLTTGRMTIDIQADHRQNDHRFTG